MKRLLSILLFLLLIPAAGAESDSVRIEYEAFDIDVPGDWYVYQEPNGESLAEEAFLCLWPTIGREDSCSLNVCRAEGTADSFARYNQYSARSVAGSAAEALGGEDVALTAFEKGERDGRDIMRYAYHMRIGPSTVYFVQLLAAMGDQGVYTFTVTYYDESELAQFEPVLESIRLN